jgi:Tol biopolymer transport system component
MWAPVRTGTWCTVGTPAMGDSMLLLRRALQLMVAVAMVSSLTLAFDGHAGAVVAGKDGKIAFTRMNQIYTIKPNGTGLVQLTTGLKNYSPRWSPDGKRIAYVHELANGQRDIWVMSAAGANKKQVTKEGGTTAAAWSPDGKWLAYGGNGGATWTTALKRIKSTAPFGTGQLLLGYTDVPEQREDILVIGAPTWSANGASIVFEGSMNDSPDYYINEYRVSDGYLDNVTASGGSCCGEGRILQPAFSANSGTLAYTHTEDFSLVSPRVLMVKWPIVQWTAVTFATQVQDEQLAFSPSGTQVALMNDAAGAPTIYIAKPNGSARRALTAGYQPDWQRLP